MLIRCPPNQVKQEAAEERKFLKGVKEKQDVDMKQFLSQQKADYRGTKVIYKRVRTYILLYLIKSVINSFIIRLTHANVWESVGKPCSCMQFIKSRIFYCKSRENPYQYCKSRKNPYQYYKSRVLHLNVQ